MTLRAADILPSDANKALLIGRVWTDDGPRVVVVRGGALCDLSALEETSSGLFDLENVATRVRSHEGERICSLDEALANERLLIARNL